jgi:transcriptional regulator with XRE-family HTH domain
MTQADLAERVGVRRETVMRWESRGEDAIPPAARTKLQASADPAHRKKQRPKRKPKPRG